MRASEFITEEKMSIKGQIINDVEKLGGNIDDYFIRFTDIDKLGFSQRQTFGRSPDIDHPKFQPDYIGAKVGKPALWFYPLKTYLKNSDSLYASRSPYVWLVRKKPNAWLQPTDKNTKTKVEAPQGKERVGLLRLASVFPAAIFFKPAYDIVGKYYDYGSKHKRHGEVKGAKPTLFQKVRGEV